MQEMFEKPRIKKAYLVINYFTLLPSIIVLGNSIYNLMLSLDIKLKTMILVDAERIAMELIVITFMILEFSPKCKDKMSCMQRFLHKKLRAINVEERYNEVPDASMATYYEPEAEKHNKLSAMK